MDPLSLTASVIAIIGIGAQAAKAISKLASMRGAPDVLLALNNEIVDLHLVVLAVQDAFQKQRTSGTSFPDYRSDEVYINDSIISSLKEAKEKTLELDALYHCLRASTSRSDGFTSLNKVAFLLEQNKVRKMQEDLRCVRLKLGIALGMLNSYHAFSTKISYSEQEKQFRAILLRLETGVHGITSELHGLRTSQKCIHDDLKDLKLSQQLIETKQQRDFTRYEAMTQAPISQLLMVQQRLELKLDVLEATNIARIADSAIRNTSQSPTHQTRSLREHNIQTFQVSTTLSRWQCTPNCICNCHRQGHMRSPHFLDKLFGTLFAGYNGIPYLTLACDSKSCQQRSSPGIMITYCFPVWLLARALLLFMRLSSARGPELIIRVPRILSNSSVVFNMARKGNSIGMKDLLQRGLASPFDVDDGIGFTPLMFAIEALDVETCQVLLHAGADPYQEDFNAHNAFHLAWKTILFKRQDKSTEGVRALFPPDHFSEDSNFSVLHKTVLGLSPLDLETLLASSPPSAIDDVDSSGRTALWWAATRGDYPAMSSLLKHKADPKKPTNAGSDPLDAVIFSKNQACIRLLLSCDCDFRFERQGYAILHACCFWGIETDIIELILRKGANLEAPDLEGNTPLAIAVQEKRTPLCDFLISQNANVNNINDDGESCLHIAILVTHPQMVRSLLQHNANYRCKTKAGETLLHYAAQYGDMECLEILRSFNLEDINVEDKVMGISPVHSSREVKGLSAIQIAEQRPDGTPGWLAMFRKLVRDIESKDGDKTSLVNIEDTETEVFEDTVVHQD